MAMKIHIKVFWIYTV